MGSKQTAPRTVHLHCTIVDNYGDIGVCWRLARQLTHEYGYGVSLWVDDWPATQQFMATLLDAPAIVDGVQIRPWSQVNTAQDCTGDVLIEGFGCTLPDATLAQLAERTIKPLWINLEYFSAESWVESFHLKSGYDSVAKARRCFFFPGVHAHSGGILREHMLLSRRDAWQASDHASPFLGQLGIDMLPDALKILCFAYGHAPYADWLEALATQPAVPLALWLCGRYTQAAFAQLDKLAYPTVALHNLSFVSQIEFDQLLWSADVVWVRGEDSLARALWSGQPFVWHIYPQAENAHHAKLAAWLAHYTQGFPAALREAYIEVHRAWNGVSPAPAIQNAWAKLMHHWDDWRIHSRIRSEALAQASDLAQRLVEFIESTDSAY